MSRLFLLFAIAATAFAQTPAITQILNNYGLEPLASAQNSGIAQGSIFIVKGSNLADESTGIQSAPLSTTLKGVRLRIVAGGVTVYAPLYYVLPTQVAGILPSNTPAGSGSLFVENNGRISPSRSMMVVQSAFGALTLNGSATGMAAVHDQEYRLLSNTNSANPGNYVTLYGSGVGPTTKDETVAQTGVNASGDLTNVPITATIGGKNAKVLYRGRTEFPGLDQINVQVPVLDAGSYSCGVLVHINVGGVYSNTTRIPVAESGRTCTEPLLNLTSFPGISEEDIAGGNLKYGFVALTRTGSQVTAAARFHSMSGPDLRYYFADQSPAASVGSCAMLPASDPPTTFYDVGYRYFDAGANLLIQGPGGTWNVPRGTTTSGLITYVTITPNATLQGGTYAFSSSGGPDVGPFLVNLSLGAPLVWTNRTTLVVTRANGMRITWNGGDASQLLTIVGLGSGIAFSCVTNQGDGSFTIPASILNRFAEGSMVTIGISGPSYPARVEVPGIDYFQFISSSAESQSVILR